MNDYRERKQLVEHLEKDLHPLLKTTKTGKVIETTEHEDGRKSVVIHVNSLNLDNPDDGDIAAKKVIEEEVLPKLAETDVLVTVIHRESLLKATVKTKYVKVRQIAEALIDGFPQHSQELHEPKTKDFIIVEVQGDEVRVTQL